MRAGLVALLISLLAFFAFAWLAPQDPGNAQVVTRLALTLQMVERGELTIDRFADRTIDKAEVDGHFYADKVPGHSLLAVPVVALARLVIPGDSTHPLVFRQFAYAATVGVNGLLTAVAVGIFFLTAIRLGAGAAGAMFGAWVLAMGTPFFGWSTAFFAHTVTGSFYVFAGAVLALGFAGEQRLDRFPVRLGFLFALLLGLTLVVDLTAAPIVALFALTSLWLAWRSGGWPRLLRFGAAAALGGVVGLLPLPIYNQLAFGDPFKLGYSSVVGFEGMQQGFFGLTFPSPIAAFELLFGLYRGLLPLAPVLIFAPLGIVVMAFRRETRLVAALIVVAFAAALWINASYHYWDGGWSTGPRHLVPVLPFLCMAMAFTWPRSLLFRLPIAIMQVVSAVIAIACASTDMFAPHEFRAPLFDYVQPAFIEPANLWRCIPVFAVGVAFASIQWWLTHPIRSPLSESK